MTRSALNVHHLRIFHALARAGSFTGAARRLGISQPAVTIQVRELEETAGVRLVERRPGRLALTPAGQALFRVADQIVTLLDEAAAVLAGAGGVLAGTLRVAGSATAGAYYVPDLLAAFRRRHPAVRIVLETSNTQGVLERVLRLTADVGVFGMPDGTPPAAAAPDPLLVAHPFVREPLVLAVPPRHPWARRRWVRPAELAGQPLLLREPGSTTRRVVESWLATAGVVPVVAMELGSHEALKRAVEAGVGLAFLGARVVAREAAAGRLGVVRVRDRGLALQFYVAHHRDRGHAPVVRAFLALAGPAVRRPARPPAPQPSRG